MISQATGAFSSYEDPSPSSRLRMTTLEYRPLACAPSSFATRCMPTQNARFTWIHDQWTATPLRAQKGSLCSARRSSLPLRRRPRWKFIDKNLN